MSQTSIILTYDTFGIPLLKVCPRVYIRDYRLHVADRVEHRCIISYDREALTLTERKVVTPSATLAGAIVSFIQKANHDIKTHIAAGKKAQIK